MKTKNGDWHQVIASKFPFSEWNTGKLRAAKFCTFLLCSPSLDRIDVKDIINNKYKKTTSHVEYLSNAIWTIINYYLCEPALTKYFCSLNQFPETLTLFIDINHQLC